MQSIAIALVAATVLVPACSQDRKADDPPERRAPVDVSAPKRSDSCREVARHFVVRYLGLGPGDDLAASVEKDCELNNWTQDERACWMQIRDMASHQRCVSEFADPRMRREDYKNPDEDADDGFPDEDIDDE